MTYAPVLPTSGTFGEFLGIQRIAEFWRLDGHPVSSVIVGDGVPPFDWLVTFVDGSVAGLEIVRAEDQTVRGKFEYWLRRLTGATQRLCKFRGRALGCCQGRRC